MINTEKAGFVPVVVLGVLAALAGCKNDGTQPVDAAQANGNLARWVPPPATVGGLIAPDETRTCPVHFGQTARLAERCNTRALRSIPPHSLAGQPVS